jgi:NADH-quinone oxidoreductase subunit L
MSATQYLLLAALVPLFTFALLIFFGGRIGRFSGALSTGLAFVTLALAIRSLLLWVDQPGFNQTHLVVASSKHWITLPTHVEAIANEAPVSEQSGKGLPTLVDSLTMAMFLLLSFLGTLIQLFSTAFIGRGTLSWGSPRFFALLNLLVFGMFGLALSNSLVQFFIFWQITGLATYFLIQFDRTRHAPVTSSLRMFVINRIGDAAFLIGMGLLIVNGSHGALTFFDEQGVSVLSEGVRRALGVRSSEFLFFTGNGSEGGSLMSLHWLSWCGICFLTAALIRAAQFPFMTWFARAADAPAPVSALLQGVALLGPSVLLIARVYPLLTMDARLILAILGCVTVVLAGLIACVQTDIRKILAWMTIAQGGYALLFLGAGGYLAGLLQLFTHAFFKTSLVLATGSVMYSLAGQTDLRQLGGLWKRLPITAATSLAAALTLAGTPYLSGAYSANLGLACVYDYAEALRGPVGGEASTFAPELLLFWVPTVMVYVLAFAIGRWWWMIFVSPPLEKNQETIDGARESGVLTLPLLILTGTFVGLWFEFFSTFIYQSVPPAVAGLTVQPVTSGRTFQTVAVLTTMAPVAFAAALLFYFPAFAVSDRLRRYAPFNAMYVYLREAFFLEPFFEGIILNGILLLTHLVMFVDRFVLAVVYRTIVYLMEGIAHAANRLDQAIDRPAARLSIGLTPLTRRWMTRISPPPAPASPPSEATGSSNP